MIARTRSPLNARMRAALAVTLLAAGLPAAAQQKADQSSIAVEDVILARKALKDAACDRMADIERMIAGGRVDLGRARIEADAMGAMLSAFPHLFPPRSNLWRPDSDQAPETATLASPDLWSNFPDFYRQAAAAANDAFALARARDIEDLKTRARVLRIACDTCHALYLEEP